MKDRLWSEFGVEIWDLMCKVYDGLIEMNNYCLWIGLNRLDQWA
jgi:hypothetical protein